MNKSENLWGFEIGQDSCATLVAKNYKKNSLSKTCSNFVAPPGFQKESALENSKSTDLDKKAKRQLAMRSQRMYMIANAPGKQILMTGFMLYMSGTSINIFSIMMTVMALSTPIKSIMSFSTVFSPFEGIDGLFRAKVTFLFLNMIGLSFGMYKLYSMGLLPVKSSDWISLLPARESIETMGSAPF